MDDIVNIGYEGSPFDLFGLPLSFCLDLTTLRQRYFQACQNATHQTDMEKIHEGFLTLSQPLSRLHALYKVFGICDHVSKEIPEKIQELSDKLFDLDADNIPEFLNKLLNFQKEIESDIQYEFEKKDWHAIENLETQLVYIVRLIDSAYRLIHHGQDE